MRIGGISFKGKNHDKNQDSYLFWKSKNKKLIVLSDGLGSRKYSEIGSKTICETIKQITQETNFEDNFDIKEFLSEIHKTWIKKILKKNINIQDCYATVLFCIFCKDKIISVRLGDGFIAFYDENNEYILYDKKEKNFVNETNSISERFSLNDWEIKILKIQEFKGALICTDGVEIANNNYNNFSKEFLNAYSNKKIKYVKKDIKRWFSEWSDHDDKTLVYMLGWRGKKIWMEI